MRSGIAVVTGVLLVASACSDGTDPDANGAATPADAAPTVDATETPEPTADTSATEEPTPEPAETATAGEPTPETATATDVDEALDAAEFASIGCNGAPAASDPERVIEVDGLARFYRLTVPTDYDGTTPLPLVLDFHGLSSNAVQQAALSGFADLAEEEGFLAVHPQGTGDIPFWDIGFDGVSVVDDVGFVSTLLDELELELCVDTSRIFSTGLSNGGYFSARLACDLSHRIAAIASVAGFFHPDDCRAERAVPILHFHGTDDPIVPYAGGTSTLTEEGGLLEQVDTDDIEPEDDIFAQAIPDEVAEFAADYACATVEEVEAEPVEIDRWTDCEDGAEVLFYTIVGGGHTWPGSEALVPFEDLVGTTTFEIDATELAWDFFVAHPLDR